MKKNRRNYSRGFTLVELIVVVAIIGVLATLVIVRYAGKTDQAKVATVKAQISQLDGAIIEFQAICNRLPTSLDELVTKPGDCPNWPEHGFLKNKNVLKDPWGTEYIYKLEGSNYEIISLGSDKRQGGTGTAADITSNDLSGGTK